MKNIIFLFIYLCLAACSEDSGAPALCEGCGLPEVTESQKVRMSDFSQELNALGSATGKHMKLDTARNLTTALSTQPKLSFSEKEQDYIKKVDDAINAGDCEVLSSGLDDLKNIGDEIEKGGDGNELQSIPKIDVRIEVGHSKNKTCPFTTHLAFNFEAKANQTANAFSMTATFGIENGFATDIGPTSYLNPEIFSYDTQFGGSLIMNANQSGVALAVNGSGSTVIQSKPELEGEVKMGITLAMSMSGSEASTTGTLKLVSDYQFKDFRAVGLIEGQFNGENFNLTYKINGQTVSEEDYNKLFSQPLADEVIGDLQERIL